MPSENQNFTALRKKTGSIPNMTRNYIKKTYRRFEVKGFHATKKTEKREFPLILVTKKCC
jgi:hypothetical protein